MITQTKFNEMKKGREESLLSVQIKAMINVKDLDTDLWCPVLKFGKKKSGEFKFPIVFKDYKKAKKLYDELDKLKGKLIAEVRIEAVKLYDKYKKYHYKNTN